MAARAAAHSRVMLRSIGFTASLTTVFVVFVVASSGCDGSAPPGDAAWVPVGPEESARVSELIRGTERPDIDPPGNVPLQAVTELATAPGGLVVGGISPADDLFWDAWFVADGGDDDDDDDNDDNRVMRRLAPVDKLVSVDAGGALWTTIVSEDESGNARYEVRLSPADGSPSVPLSSGLPPSFSAERIIADGNGTRLLIGTEQREDGVQAASVFAVAADGGARRIARDPERRSALVLGAAVTPDALYIALLYDAADAHPTIVKVPAAAISL